MQHGVLDRNVQVVTVSVRRAVEDQRIPFGGIGGIQQRDVGERLRQGHR